MLAKAIALASQLAVNSVDKQGKPMILHYLFVMNKVRNYGDEVMQIAVLHDLLEDFNDQISMLKLLEMGFSKRVVNAVVALTHLPEEEYMDYIRRVALNEDARIVKLADLEHNSMITRLKSLRQSDFQRMEKYQVAYTYLSK